jgi:BirA family biotin operon repressor/biotin-[acetyl-CoA-carboxylase] ligase
MALAGAEAVAEAARVKPGLRWPNDLLIGEQKVGGVLVETQVSAERVAAAVLSLGLNVNLSVHDLPPQVQASATSLREATDRDHALEIVAARVLESLERLQAAVTDSGLDLVERWQRWDALLGSRVLVALAETALQGSVQGIASDGALLLATAAGTTAIAAGEVRKVTAGAR